MRAENQDKLPIIIPAQPGYGGIYPMPAEGSGEVPLSLADNLLRTCGAGGGAVLDAMQTPERSEDERTTMHLPLKSYNALTSAVARPESLVRRRAR